MSTTKTPIRTVYDGSNAAVGLAEYQNGEVVGIEHGGTGGNTVAAAKLSLSLTDSNIRSLISVTGGGSYSNTTGIITIQSTDLTPYAKTTDLTTANVTELTNLYYTIDRANTAINNRVTKAFVDALGIDATTLDGIDSLPFAKDEDLTTANVSELTNLYFTNARVYSNVTSIGYATNTNVSLKANIVDLTTANVGEVNNLYFTNARSRAAISEGTGVNYNSSTGIISIGQNVDSNSSVTFANVTITGNLLVQGNAILFESNTLVITDPLIQVGKDPVGDTVDLGFFGHYLDGNSVERHAGLFRDASDGQFKLFANLFPEPATIVATADASYNSANLVLNYVVGRVTDVSNHTTADITENTNLYFTNARAQALVTPAYNTANTAVLNASAAFESSNTKVATVAGFTGTNISNSVLLTGVVSADAFSLLPAVFNQTGITGATVVYTFNKTTYRAAELLFTITNGTAYKVVKTLVIHDGTNITFGDNYLDDNEVTIGTINTSYSFSISGDDVRLVITTSQGTATVKGKVNLVAI